MKEKGTKKRAAGNQRNPTESLFKEIPGFMYIAEISEDEFRPLKLFGGFTSLTGYEAKDFLIPDYYDKKIVDPKDYRDVRLMRSNPTSEPRFAEISYHLNTRSGKKILVSERMTGLSDHSQRRKVGGIVSVSGSQSARLYPAGSGSSVPQIEEIRKMNADLLEANHLKDEFLTNTSHELRTPLNSIIGFLTLLTEGYYEDNGELKLFTKNALDSAYHLLDVINDLLDISRIEAGAMHAQIEKVLVDDVLEEVRSVFELLARQKGLVLKCSTESSPLYAAADVQQLKQVLINVIGNAIKFTPGGTVKLTAGLKGSEVVFVAEDTGIGIPPDMIDKLFHKFVQIDGSATRKYGGTGLGLAISKHLVEMMGGRIQIESRGPGTGTTVRLSIPAWTKEEE